MLLQTVDITVLPCLVKLCLSVKYAEYKYFENGYLPIHRNLRGKQLVYCLLAAHIKKKINKKN